MAELFIDGRPVQAEPGATVMEAAVANGSVVPGFCWHPHLSVAGNCRLCLVEVEDEKNGNWRDIACNMPVTEGMRVLTDSAAVREHRKAMLQLTLLNHPVDCGICDKAGECTLQDYHFEYNGETSVSRDAKVRATKLYALSDRIVLDNERCILCSRCVRFTAEVSRSHALGIEQRGDHSLVRAAEDGRFGADPYSDNVVDLCPVGALLSRPFLHKARVWYLEATPSVCPGCERGCSVRIWHRKPEWHLQALDPRHNRSIARVTPLENPAVNGPWICNKGRDLARVFERPRAERAMLQGAPVDLAAAVAAARRLIDAAERPVALVSSWGSNEELAAFKNALGRRFASFVREDCRPEPGEPIEDHLLIRPDKNPNRAGARKLFGDAAPAFGDADLVLVWGEGFDFGRLPGGAKLLLLDSYDRPENARADVFVPLSVQTERRGHYTNFQGVVSAFEPCFAKPASVADAEWLFAALAAPVEAPA